MSACEVVKVPIHFRQLSSNIHQPDKCMVQQAKDQTLKHSAVQILLRTRNFLF